VRLGLTAPPRSFGTYNRWSYTQVPKSLIGDVYVSGRFHIHDDPDALPELQQRAIAARARRRDRHNNETIIIDADKTWTTPPIAGLGRAGVLVGIRCDNGHTSLIGYQVYDGRLMVAVLKDTNVPGGEPLPNAEL